MLLLVLVYKKNYAIMFKKSHLLIGVLLLATVLTACKKEAVFNQADYDNLVRASFPVQNVDPSQTWTTVGTATAEVTVNGDYGETYKVVIYLDNPLSSDTPTKAFTGSVESGKTLKGTMSFKVAQDFVYVGIYDKDGRRVVLNAPVENGTVKVVYGASASNKAARRATDAETSTYAKSLEDYLNPTGPGLNVKVVTVEEMKSYTAITDDIIANETSNKNHTLTDKSYYYSPADYPGHSDGKHFRVAKGTEITEVFHINAAGVINDCVLYVEGKVHLNGNTLTCPTLVVADGGEIILEGNTQLTGVGRFIVLPGGKITGKKDKLWDNTNNSYCYNAGTMEMQGILNLNGSNFYNCGTMNIDVLTGTAGGTKFTNFGHITARTNSYSGSSYNQSWVNGCYVHFTGDAGVGSSILLTGSRFDVDGNIDVLTGTVEMHHQSELKCGNLLMMNGATINGPTSGGEYAIVKTSKLYATWSGSMNVNNLVYFDFNPDEIYGLYNDKNKNYKKEQTTGDYRSSAAYDIVNTKIKHWVNEQNALNEITIPAGCAGTGFNPDGNEGGSQPASKAMGFRFLFEDNFPDPGDYDFNDVVIKVTPEQDENNPKKVTLTVNLEASGALKTNAAAIRLVGITDGMLASKSCTQRFAAPPGNLGRYDNIPDGDFAVSGAPDDGSSVVLLLCKDVHWALNPVLNGGGNVDRFFYNTTLEGWTNYGRVPAKTATYVFEFNSEADAQKMLDQATYDTFIVENYNGSFWEVHTVQNDRKGALVLRYSTFASTYQDYLRAYCTGEAANKPWAVMVPGSVEYPLEGRPITIAYPDFTYWGQNQNNSTDWYERPASGNTFPLHYIYK